MRTHPNNLDLAFNSLPFDIFEAPKQLKNRPYRINIKDYANILYFIFLMFILVSCQYQKQQIKPRFKVIANNLGTYKSVECDSFYYVNQTEINYYVKDSQGTISAKELIVIDKYGI